MIDVRFGSLDWIVIEQPMPPGLGKELPEGSRRTAHAIPGHTIQLDAAIRVLNAIERSHDDDLVTTRPYRDPLDVPDVEAGRAFTERETGRICAYVVYATTLEGVIEASYKHAKSWLQRIAPTEFLRVGHEHASLRKTRRTELADLRAVRNKVFAHTAFAEPKKPGTRHAGDSLTTQISSLVYFVGEPSMLIPEGTVLGAAYVAVGDDHAGKLPSLSVARAASIVGSHIAGWHAMYADVMNRLCARSDAEIRAAMPDVIEVRRSTTAPRS